MVLLTFNRKNQFEKFLHDLFNKVAKKGSMLTELILYLSIKPGGGGSSPYSSQCVTRGHQIQSFTWFVNILK